MLAVFVQLTYIQEIKLVSAALGAYSPTQSREVGATIPLHVAVTIPPAPMVVGLTFRIGVVATRATENLLLVASRV